MEQQNEKSGKVMNKDNRKRPIRQVNNHKTKTIYKTCSCLIRLLGFKNIKEINPNKADYNRALVIKLMVKSKNTTSDLKMICKKINKAAKIIIQNNHEAIKEWMINHKCEQINNIIQLIKTETEKREITIKIKNELIIGQQTEAGGFAY